MKSLSTFSNNILTASFGLLVLLFCFLCFSPNSASAAGNQAFRSGGFVVIVHGLTDTDIEVEFAASKKSVEGKQSTHISIIITATDGSFIQQIDSKSPNVDLSSLSLSPGKYLLNIQAESMMRTVPIRIGA